MDKTNVFYLLLSSFIFFFLHFLIVNIKYVLSDGLLQFS